MQGLQLPRFRSEATALCLLLPLLTAAAPAAGGDEVRVITGIDPIAALVEEVAGGSVRVLRLYPPGAAPSTTEPDGEALREASGAPLYFRTGRRLEGKDEKAVLKAAGGSTAVIDLSAGLDLIGLSKPEETERKIFTSALGLDESSLPSGENPYFWLDPLLADAVSMVIADRLVRVAPEEADAIREHSRRLSERLVRLDGEIRERLALVGDRRMAVFTGAASYFARRYGIGELPVTGVTPGGGPGRQSLKGTVARIRSLGVHAVFTDSLFPRSPAESAAARAGVPLLTLYPFGTPEHAGYFDMMRFNLFIIEEGLR